MIIFIAISGNKFSSFNSSSILGSKSSILKAIGDQTRLELLELLIDGEQTSSMIQEKLNKSQSTISQHLKTLIDANIITFKRGSRIRYYRIENRKFLDLLMNIQSFVIEINRHWTLNFFNHDKNTEI